MIGTVRNVDDPKAWDEFVSRSGKPHILQSWAWGDLKARSGWRPRRIVVDREGQWRMGISLLERDFPKIGRRFFYSPRGPVPGADWKASDMDALMLKVRELAKERRAVFLKIDPDVPISEDWVTPLLESSGFCRVGGTGGFSGVQPRCVFRLDISPTEEEILKAMDSKTRYNIRLAEKKGVKIRQVNELEDIATFQKILQVTARRDGFMARPLKYFCDIRELLGERGQAQFFLAEAAGRALGGTLALTIGPVCWYAYGASANEDRNLMPNYLLQWEMIRWAKSKGCRTYDFRAVPCDILPNNPLYGLYRFKKGFGGTMTTFVGEFDLPYSQWLYAAWTRAWPVFQKIRKTFKTKTSSDEVD